MYLTSVLVIHAALMDLQNKFAKNVAQTPSHHDIDQPSGYLSLLKQHTEEDGHH